MSIDIQHSAACDYCGLPIGRRASSTNEAYCCYGCRFAASINSQRDETDMALGPASALALSVFFTMNVVMLTMALWSYAQLSERDFETALRAFLRYGALLFSMPVLLLLGRPLASHAIAGLRAGILSTDLLLATGVLAAFALSIVNTLKGSGHVYFEVGCVILVLVTAGRYLEATGRSQASKALENLERLVPDSVRLLKNTIETSVPRSQVKVGEVIRVLAGERIPVDGRVIRGRGVVDEQFFTGESIPIEKIVGDPLLGGSLNLDGTLVIEVVAPPQGGALGKLIAAVKSARASKSRYEILADAWSRRFFPIITVTAIAALIFHSLRVDWEFGLLTSLSVILIACPCALALATPLAIWSALAKAASKGVICQSGEVLEKLSRVRAIRWDKTGTLTTGTPRVGRFIVENDADHDELLLTALKMTSASNHVFSRAIHDYGLEWNEALGVGPSDSNDRLEVIQNPLKCDFDQCTADCEIQTVPGKGLRAVNKSGVTIAVLGSVRWMADNQCIWAPNLSVALNSNEVQDKPVVAIGITGTVKGLFVLDETIRLEAADVVQQLKELGLDQSILTGDRQSRAIAFSQNLNLSVQSELLPEQKLMAIRMAQKSLGLVAMIGDGLNDAPALAASDIGIALGCGADVSRESADLCILSSDLRLIPWTYELSRQTVRTIKTNLAWSFSYNSLGVVLAASGQLHPAVAAVLMVVSSLMVLGNSLKLTIQNHSDERTAGQKPGDHQSLMNPAMTTGVGRNAR